MVTRFLAAGLVVVLIGAAADAQVKVSNGYGGVYGGGVVVRNGNLTRVPSRAPSDPPRTLLPDWVQKGNRDVTENAPGLPETKPTPPSSKGGTSTAPKQKLRGWRMVVGYPSAPRYYGYGYGGFGYGGGFGGGGFGYAAPRGIVVHTSSGRRGIYID